MFAGRKALTFKEEAVIGYGRKDGQPRILLNTSDLRLKIPAAKLGRRLVAKGYRLGDILECRALFDAYPEFRDFPVAVKQVAAAFTPTASTTKSQTDQPEQVANRRLPCEGLCSADKINLWPQKGGPDTEVVLALVHEVQHLIQNREGFARGTNREYAWSVVPKDMVVRRQKAAALAQQHGHEAASERIGRNINNIKYALDTEDAENHHLCGAAYRAVAKRTRLWYLNTSGEFEARLAADIATGSKSPGQYPHIHLGPGPADPRKDPFLLRDRNPGYSPSTAILAQNLRFDLERAAIQAGKGQAARWLDRVAERFRRLAERSGPVPDPTVAASGKKPELS